jgi:hypothetical protein
VRLVVCGTRTPAIAIGCVEQLIDTPAGYELARAESHAFDDTSQIVTLHFRATRPAEVETFGAKCPRPKRVPIAHAGPTAPGQGPCP